MAHGSKKIVYAALGANAAVAVGKFIVGIAIGSVAMLAEAAHSVADTINQVFLLISINLSDNPADEDHPYGHGKERFFWAFLAAIFIFVAGAFFSVYEGVQKMFAEHGDHGTLWPAYLVLGLAFLFDGGVLVVALRESGRQARQLGLSRLQFLRETSDVTLKTALYEDVAATIGIVIAVSGLVLLQVTGNAIFDGLASILIGLVLIAVAIMLGAETRNLLLGAAAEPRDRQSIRAVISSFPEISSIVALLTMQLGLSSILVTGEINLSDDLTADEIENLMEHINRSIREAVPAVKNIYLEPHKGQDRVAPRPSPAGDAG